MYPAIWLLGVLLSSKCVEAIGRIRRSVDRQLQTTTVGQVENLRLINADTNQPILNLTNNLVINIYSLNASNFSIQATTIVNSDTVVGSIRFAYNGNVRFRTDSVMPFSMCPTAGGRDYQTCAVLLPGAHTVTATPFVNANATGMIGIPYQITFQIVNESPTPMPISVVTYEPTNAPKAPTVAPTTIPTSAPIVAPASLPTGTPTKAPTTVPTSAPIVAPASLPTGIPTKTPTTVPTSTPIVAPATLPTGAPTKAPTTVPTSAPIVAPASLPTAIPTKAPTTVPTSTPIVAPATLATGAPTKAPTKEPTSAPLSSCQVPQFLDDWQNFNPTYPLKNGEPQGLLVGDDLVIFGGFTNSFTIATNQTYARDLTGAISSVWRRMDDMPLALGITHAATVVVGQKVYICGGYQGPHPGPHVPYCFIYDHSKAPGSGQWSNFTFLPNGGTAGAGMIYDSSRNMLFYAGGGQRLIPNSVHPIDVNETWKISLDDPSTGWMASSQIPYTANHLSYVTHQDAIGTERHFFLAGQEQEYESSRNLAENYEFVAASETWIRRAEMPFPRGHAAASTRAFGCGFIIAGGSANSNSTRKNRIADISYYDIPSDTWTAGIGMLPSEGATPIVVVHPNGYIHFVNAAPISSRRRIVA